MLNTNNLGSSDFESYIIILNDIKKLGLTLSSDFGDDNSGFNTNSGYVRAALDDGFCIASQFGNESEFIISNFENGDEFFFDNYEDAKDFNNWLNTGNNAKKTESKKYKKALGY